MTKNDLMTKIETLTNALEASRETSDRLARQCCDKDAELASLRVSIEIGALAACQRDLADRDAEISRLNAAIEKGAQTQEWQRRQIADRDTLIARLRSDIETMGTAHASDHLELVARREECEKQERTIIGLNNDLVRYQETLASVTTERAEWKAACKVQQQDKIKARDQRDEQALARQRVQIQLDQATARIAQLEAAPCDRPVALFHAEQRLSEEIGKSRALGEELRKVRQALEAERGIVSRMGGELTEAKQALAPFLAAGGVVAVSVEVKACPCEPLQEHLANLHRTGAVILKQQQTLSGAMVAFIQAHTRAGDVLEGIENGESF